jgi:AcrR family transcriptional regulator
MEQNTKIAAKKRIFDAAVSLFARRGFAAVGIREIAKKAGVNISMINYYFNGKAGILKEIINECYDKYYSAILDTGGEKTPLEERVRYLTRNMVDFFRKNTELAIVAFSTIPVDIPEIIDLKIKWIESKREATNKWFKTLGMDVKNAPLMCVIRSFLTSIIFGFVEAQYCCDHIVQAPAMPIHLQDHFKHDDYAVVMDDSFYKKYVEILGCVYLHGVMSMSKKKSKKRSKKKRK